MLNKKCLIKKCLIKKLNILNFGIFKVETSPPVLDINHALFQLKENEVRRIFKEKTRQIRLDYHQYRRG